MLPSRGEQAKAGSQFSPPKYCGGFSNFVEMVGFEGKKKSFTFLGAISRVSLWIFLGCGCRKPLECLFEVAGRQKRFKFGQ